MLKRKSIQMELNFNGAGRNRFRDRMNEGIFQVLAEIPVPSATSQWEDAVARYSDFQYVVEATEYPAAGLAFTDVRPDAESLDPVLFMSAVCKENGDTHLLYLRGRERSEAQILGEAKHAVSLGFHNFCAVSGSAPENATASTLRSTYFLESVNILHKLHEAGDSDFLVGATVNPFKYTPENSAVQYCKAIRKIDCGASFLVSQYGWDMLKLQELRWQLWRRDFNIPVFARLMFLSFDLATDICAERVPGIRVSPDFAAELKREMQYSAAQFKAAQIRRLQLHAAGAYFLGYSGIQLGGIDQPELFQSLLQRIGEALHEFISFEDWKNAYIDYYSRMDLAPYPYRYYLFENLFSQAQPPDEFVIRNEPIAGLSKKEQFQYFLSDILFRHASELPPGERRFSKKILLGCRFCEKCRVSKTLYVCPEQCPKGMTNGACGCSKPDGSCEYTGKECLFVRRLRIANAKMAYDNLETGCIEQPLTRP